MEFSCRMWVILRRRSARTLFSLAWNIFPTWAQSLASCNVSCSQAAFLASSLKALSFESAASIAEFGWPGSTLIVCKLSCHKIVSCSWKPGSRAKRHAFTSFRKSLQGGKIFQVSRSQLNCINKIKQIFTVWKMVNVWRWDALLSFQGRPSSKFQEEIGQVSSPCTRRYDPKSRIYQFPGSTGPRGGAWHRTSLLASLGSHVDERPDSKTEPVWFQSFSGFGAIARWWPCHTHPASNEGPADSPGQMLPGTARYRLKPSIETTLPIHLEFF